MEAAGIAALLLALALVGGAVGAAVLLANRRRREDLRELAARMAFSFEEKPSGVPALLEALPLGSRGRRPGARCAMQGRTGNVETLVCDHHYTTGGGRNSTTHRQTVVVLRRPGMELPVFALSPRTFFHRLGALVGARPIALEGQEEFTRRCHLTGADEERIRGLFRRDVVAFFEENPGLSVQAQGDTLAVWRAGRRVPPADVPVLLRQAAQLLQLLAR